MEITLNHTIVYSHDNVLSAKFYEKIFGFEYLKQWGHFAVLKINSTLTFDFMDKKKFTSQHYAFKVNDEQFSEIFSRLRENKIVYGSGPNKLDDMRINYRYGGRGVYFKDPNGHILEILTADYVID